MFLCQAGRLADFGGRWLVACPKIGRHRLSWPGGDFDLMFCDDHIRQLIDAGLITDPNLSEEEYAEMKAERVEPSPSEAVNCPRCGAETHVPISQARYRCRRCGRENDNA